MILQTLLLAALPLFAAAPPEYEDPSQLPVELQVQNLRTSFNALEAHMRRNQGYRHKLGPVSERLGELDERLSQAKSQEEINAVRSDFRALRRELHKDPWLPDELK